MALSESQRKDIKWAIDDLQSRSAQYKLYSDYYAGEQKSLALASPEFNSAVSFLKGFNENLCATVVDVLKDRLKLTGFTHDQAESDTSIIEKIEELWKLNRIDKRQGELFLEVIKTGDSYAFVWPDDNGDPKITPNKACMVAAQYSDEQLGTIVKAGKAWLGNDKFGRLNLYYPDRTEKFRTTNKVQGDFTLRPEAYTFESSVPNPYGQVPIFHFANNADTGSFGVSEIKAAIPSQDRLNKTIIDGLVVGEEHSLPVRYALGFESAIDPVTKKPIMDWKPGDWWISRQKDGSLGQLPGADMNQFVAAANDARHAIARVTRTPLHYFQSREGVPPSGEALKTEEAPLTAKVRDRQISFGNVWEDLFTFALRIAGIEGAQLESIWANTEPRDETAEITNQVQKVKNLGFSKKQSLRELEYSDAEINKIETEKEDETAAQPSPELPNAQMNQRPNEQEISTIG